MITYWRKTPPTYLPEPTAPSQAKVRQRQSKYLPTHLTYLTCLTTDKYSLLASLPQRTACTSSAAGT